MLLPNSYYAIMECSLVCNKLQANSQLNDGITSTCI